MGLIKLMMIMISLVIMFIEFSIMNLVTIGVTCAALWITNKNSKVNLKYATLIISSLFVTSFVIVYISYCIYINSIPAYKTLDESTHGFWGEYLTDSQLGSIFILKCIPSKPQKKQSSRTSTITTVTTGDGK